MSETSIDVFCHFLPPEYCDAVTRMAKPPLMFPRAVAIPAMVDVEARLRIMDDFPGYSQVLSLASPTLEVMATPDVSPELARIGNDAMAALVERYPDRFVSWIASLPMNNPEASIKEATRAINEQGACGVQVYTNVAGRPLDEPEFLDVFAHMAELGRPVWLHPIRPMTFADYKTEAVSKFDIWWSLGWPYETGVAMTRLAFAGVFDRWPELVIVTHHVGGIIPLMDGRMGSGMELLGTRNPPDHADAVATDLKESPADALRRFYADTASVGSRAAIECGQAFFGIDHLLFATDMPFDPERGPGYIRETLAVLEQMALAPDEKEKILRGNAKRLLRL